MTLSSICWGFSNIANFSGTLVETPCCEINEVLPIEVDFGAQVITTDVDGVNYKKEIVFMLVCKNNPQNTMRLQLSGMAEAWDATLLGTDNSNVAIKFLQRSGDGTQLNLNSWLNFTYPVKPVLQAVSVKRERTAC